MISLVMLSGGIDSTYVLARMLREFEDEVVVHHIHCLNDSQRHVAEQRACNQIVAYCRENYRDFAYSETMIDHRRMLSHGIDMIAAGFEAGVVSASYALATNKNIDRWLVGLLFGRSAGALPRLCDPSQL